MPTKKFVRDGIIARLQATAPTAVFLVCEDNTDSFEFESQGEVFRVTISRWPVRDHIKEKED